MKTIEGKVLYRERMALPPNAEIRVSLEDVARMDVPSEVIATTRFVPEGGPPWAFTLEYDPQTLQDKGRFVLRARIEADGRLLFTNGESVPAFGRDAAEPVQVLVSRVPGGRGGEGAKVPDASLTETYWKLIELDGQGAVIGAGGRELHMVLASDGSRVHGFSGCNRLTGSYQRTDGQLSFSQLASTRRACMEGMEQEQRFLDALGRTTRFRIRGDQLTLDSADAQPTMRFVAVALQ
jgi:putative lipoprotein